MKKKPSNDRTLNNELPVYISREELKEKIDCITKKIYIDNTLKLLALFLEHEM